MFRRLALLLINFELSEVYFINDNAYMFLKVAHAHLNWNKVELASASCSGGYWTMLEKVI